MREEENDVFFDVIFDDKYEAGDNENVVTTDFKEECPEIEMRPDVLADEENSSSSDTKNQVEFTRNEFRPDDQVESTRKLILSPEIQAPPIPPSRGRVYEDRRKNYLEMKDAGREASKLKRAEMSRNPPQRYGQSVSHNLMFVPKEPESYNQAISCSEKENCLQAMQEEPNSLCDTNTWTLVERQKEKNIIPGKWVYKVQTRANGSLGKYKARYVAEGFKQIKGVDYFETFAATSKPVTFRPILSLAVKENFTLRQTDVKSAYLHPEIREELYLEQPMGFEKLDSCGKKLVCRSNKWIYGLKQAAKNWYEELANFLIEQSFVRSKNDYCLFSKKERQKLFVLSWVDDLVIAGSSSKDIEDVKKT